MNIIAKVVWVLATWIVSMVVCSIPAVGVLLTNRVAPDFFVWFSLTSVFISCWKTRTRLSKVVKGLEL